MKIEYDNTKFVTTVTDLDKANWRAGEKVYYDLPKDKRPDFNPYSDIEAGTLFNYVRNNYPINEVPQEVIETLENLWQLEDAYQKYLYHALAVCLDPNRDLVNKSTSPEGAP